MKKRKSGNSFKSLKEICQEHGVQFSNQPSNNLIIIDENGIEHIVGGNFNLFNDNDMLYQNLKFSQVTVFVEKYDNCILYKDINYNNQSKIDINYSNLKGNTFKFGNYVA